MISEYKFSAREVMLTILCMLPSLLLLYVPGYAAVEMGIDSWLMFVVFCVLDLLLCWVILKVRKMAPGKTAIGISREAFGEFGGAIIGFLFVVLFGFKAMLSFKQALDYINTSIQASIPFIYFAIPMILLLIYAQFKGPAVFVRVGNFVIWLTLASYFIIMVTAVKEFEINNLRPFLVNGLESVAGNIWRFFPWCGNIVFLLMFFDKVDVKKGFEKKILTAVGIAYGIVLALDVIFLGVFGVMAKFMTFSIMELSQYLSGMVFSNRMDTIIRLIWILSAFVRDVVFVYCFAESAAELIKKRQSKIWIVAATLLIILPELIFFENENVYFGFIMNNTSIICGALQYGLPLLLYAGLCVCRGNRMERERCMQ